MAQASPNTASIYITATDLTKTALKQISANFDGLKSKIGSVVTISAALGASFVALNKYASLMDFEKFDVGAAQALKFTDTLKLAGMDLTQVDKAFTELSVNVEKGINDEKVRKTFSELGIGIEKLKHAPLDQIYDDIFKKLGEIDDKQKALALSKEVFGKNGAKIFDAAQDGQVQAFQKYMEQFKNEINLAAKEADNLDKNLNTIKNVLINDLANAFGPILVPVNALLTTFREWLQDLNKGKTELELLSEVDVFSQIIFDCIDFINILTEGIARGLALLDGLWESFKYGATFITLTADTLIHGFGGAFKIIIAAGQQFLLILQSIATLDFSSAKDQILGLGKAMNDSVKGMENEMANLDTRWDNLASGGQKVKDAWAKAFKDERLVPEIDKDSFRKNLKAEIDKAQQAINSANKDKTDRKGIGFDTGFKDNLDQKLKMLQLAYDREKFDIDLMSKYNEMYYNNLRKTTDQYYSDKKRLMEDDYNANRKNLEAQLALAQQGVGGNISEKEKLNYQTKILELQNKIINAEKEYAYKVAETNEKELKDRLNKEISIKDQKLSQISSEEQVIAIKTANNVMGIFEANEKIIVLRKQAIEALEDQIKAMEERLKDTPDDFGLSAKLDNARVQLEKFRQEIDPIATQINQAIGGAFSTFFSDVVSGTKSVKDAFISMGQQIERTITNIVSQALAQKLMASLFSGGSGGIGGMFSNLFTHGMGGGMGGLFGGAFASGGYTDGNKPILVGERGPEIYFPSSPGTVLNNQDTQNMLSNNGRPVVMNITTQDAQSFRSSKPQIMAEMNRALAMSQRNL